MENSHKHENAKDSEATLGIDDVLDKEEKGRNGVLDLGSGSGLLTGS